jgi:hypothetical protein
MTDKVECLAFGATHVSEMAKDDEKPIEGTCAKRVLYIQFRFTFPMFSAAS